MIRTKNDIECFKRSSETSAHYYYRFVVPTRWRKTGVPARVLRSSGTSILSEARDRGWQDFQRMTGLAAALPENGFFLAPERKAFKSPYRLVDEALAYYVERAPVVLAGASSGYRANANAIRRILKLAGLDIEKVRLDCLCSKTYELWIKARYGEAGLKWPAAMKEASKLNVSLNSEYRQASAVFGLRARREVFQGWVWPKELEGFLSRPRLRESSVRFVPIPRLEEMDKVFAKHPDTWVRMAYELARYCGLRRGELVAARWNWIERSGTGWVLRVESREEGEVESFGTKNKKSRAIPITDERLGRWKNWANSDGLGGCEGWLVKKEGLGDGRVGRLDSIGREMSALLREWLPGREKSLHELRKAAGSQVLMKTKSMAMCAEFLGDTIAVAEAHYGRVELAGAMDGL